MPLTLSSCPPHVLPAQQIRYPRRLGFPQSPAPPFVTKSADKSADNSGSPDIAAFPPYPTFGLGRLFSTAWRYRPSLPWRCSLTHILAAGYASKAAFPITLQSSHMAGSKPSSWTTEIEDALACASSCALISCASLFQSPAPGARAPSAASLRGAALIACAA
ncbi:hypothetical protein DFH08DRAFT_60878 [Mycena albidolilacea]|uniref:Uncharacterized protein n=1 Tax=Mycena albidolilacea TaxID=1033008 RepID=A0AAD7A9Z0_9AGAR|nr:hypothetical protein DFH08DRAFT_60878 [Mycena albidolilacea]